MKRIVIIFIIVCFLISFVGVSYPAEQSYTSGDFWNDSIFMEKTIYITGFRMGILEGLLQLGSLIPRAKGSELSMARDELYFYYEFIREHVESIIKVMDDLYKDPANTYIQAESICKIACQKLKGEDIEPLLQEAREEALQKRSDVYITNEEDLEAFIKKARNDKEGQNFKD